MAADLAGFVRALPKAELHVHVEGTLEPEMMLMLAEKNGVDLPYADADAVRAAYDFSSLQDFLDLYYLGMSVLMDAEDFRGLSAAYLARAADDGVRHAEVFFDPQGHTSRGVPFDAVVEGVLAGLSEGGRIHGISTGLIMCFLRDRPEESALELLDEARPFLEDGRIIGIGLDSTERGNPPEKFARVYAAAGEMGLHRVAHAGEEGPAAFVRDSIDLLGVERVDHGIAAVDDPPLVARLAEEGTPLTVCPVSNVKLRCVPDMARHPLKQLFDSGVKVTVNSDDPAYFGGYVTENYLQAADGLGLGREELTALAHNSIDASFAEPARKRELLAELEGLSGN